MTFEKQTSEASYYLWEEAKQENQSLEDENTKLRAIAELALLQLSIDQVTGIYHIVNSALVNN